MAKLGFCEGRRTEEKSEIRAERRAHGEDEKTQREREDVMRREENEHQVDCFSCLFFFWKRALGLDFGGGGRG